MNQIINTALVGYGLSGQAFHAPFLHVNEGFALKQVVERKRKESVKIYPYVQVVSDFETVIQNKEIDLVVIGTPNAFHYDQVKACLQEGKHVVIEKPFMNSSKDCDVIMEMASKHDRQLFVFHNRRWDGDFLTLNKIIQTGVLGEIQYFESHFDRFSPERKRAAWRDIAQPGGGILYDLGPHLLDQAIQLFGLPQSIKADIEAQRENSPVDDYFHLTLGYPDLKVVLTAGMLVEDHDLRYVLHGANGSFIKYGLDPQEAKLKKGLMPLGEDWGKEDPTNYGLITLDDESEDFDGVIETLPGNYMGFYDNVYDTIINDVALAVKPSEARNVIRLIELAFESNEKGEELTISL